MRKRRILLYKNGEVDSAARDELGCYECWFGRALPDGITLEIHRAFAAPRRPLSGYDGLLLSGSPRSVLDREPWMEEAAVFLREVARAGVPILGICFGHQLLGHAFGAEVRKSPRGWEAGTTSVRLTAAGRRDPLFAGLGEPDGQIAVNQSHRDEVAAAAPGATVLAENDHSPVQALAFGDHVRSVQFHPEMGAAEVRCLINHRRALLDADARAQGRPERAAAYLLSHAADTPIARRTLDNWLNHFVRHT